jgi:hypothetical protein
MSIAPVTIINIMRSPEKSIDTLLAESKIDSVTKFWDVMMEHDLKTACSLAIFGEREEDIENFKKILIDECTTHGRNVNSVDFEYDGEKYRLFNEKKNGSYTGNIALHYPAYNRTLSTAKGSVFELGRQASETGLKDANPTKLTLNIGANQDIEFSATVIQNAWTFRESNSQISVGNYRLEQNGPNKVEIYPRYPDTLSPNKNDFMPIGTISDSLENIVQNATDELLKADINTETEVPKTDIKAWASKLFNENILSTNAFKKAQQKIEKDAATYFKPHLIAEDAPAMFKELGTIALIYAEFQAKSDLSNCSENEKQALFQAYLEEHRDQWIKLDKIFPKRTGGEGLTSTLKSERYREQCKALALFATNEEEMKFYKLASEAANITNEALKQFKVIGMHPEIF